MKTFFIILIFLEVVFALIAFTSVFINSEKTIQATSEAAIKVANSPTPENEISWLRLKAKFNRERWVKGIAAFVAVSFLPGIMLASIIAIIFRRKNLRQAIQS